ncbi:unnamed protein product [Pseudo-nitzschia multistriata]|uniref:Uncharacterized protein n=1 Tax=Pseudo-nitzschia multistriata TaxID=183589 RepID=A0A448ZFT0_9STRA|nr:unnamed protein product [Pseudo-nitzschia multistriata]
MSETTSTEPKPTAAMAKRGTKSEEKVKPDTDQNLCTATNNTNDQPSLNKKSVRFGSVFVRLYGITIGCNPATSLGASVCLTWDYDELLPEPLDTREGKKPKRKKNTSPSTFYLSYYRREGILKRAGFSKEDFDRHEKLIQRDRLKRKISTYQCYPILFAKSFGLSRARRKSRTFVKKYRKEKRNKKKQTINKPKEQARQ